MTAPRRVAPARVLAALEVLGWPDDREEQPVDVPPGIHYRTVEEAIQAADDAEWVALERGELL